MQQPMLFAIIYNEFKNEAVKLIDLMNTYIYIYIYRHIYTHVYIHTHIHILYIYNINTHIGRLNLYKMC